MRINTALEISLKLFGLWLLSALISCGGSNEMTAEIEMCLDQGGEWTENGCQFEPPKCLVQAYCKVGAEECPCVLWEDDL